LLRSVGLRILGSLALLIIVPAITFLIQSIVPTNIAQSILGLGATKSQIAALNESLGLNQPAIVRYGEWFVGSLHGDLGTSYVTNQAVTVILAPRIGVSLSLVIGALLVFTTVGLLLGVLSTNRNRVVGRIIDVVSSAGIAIPNFWLGVLLIGLFAVQLNVLPATGYVPAGQDPGLWIASLVLPVLALAFGGITAVAKQTRDQMLLALDSSYIRSLRSNGIPMSSLVYKHALRNASGPTVTVLGLIFVGALSGSVVVENIFVLPGLGSQAVESATQHDLPVIQGIALYFTIIVVIVNVLIDIVIPLLNPKVRAS
jgi:peptide/nickel transport system permease protein